MNLFNSHMCYQEIDELCDSWKPEPLVPENPDDVPELPSSPLVYSSAAKEMVVDNKLVKNFGTYDFLGFVGDKDITVRCDFLLLLMK